MCGIAGVHIKNPEFVQNTRDHALLERFCDRLLLGIENRGHDAAGFVASTWDAKTILDKKDVTASSFIKTRKRIPEGTRTVLLHTRFATQGPKEVWANNHPVFSGTVFTVHNGTIRNDNTLFKKYDIDRSGTVDSEIIPALLHKYGFEEADKAFEELTGGFATASIDPIRYPGWVVLSANGIWPLVILDNKNFIVWASESEAIKEAWGAVFGTPPQKSYEHFESGDMVVIKDAEVDRRPDGFVPSGTWSRSSQSWNMRSTGGSWWDDEEDSEYDWYGCKIPKDKNKTRVVSTKHEVWKLRREGKGQCVAFMDRNKYADFLKEFGNDKWFYCTYCEETVADVQVVKKSQLFGDICLDCYSIAKPQFEDQNKWTVDEYIELLDMEDDVYKQLQAFADMQTYIHNRALTKLADTTGVKRTTIDFLLHRADLSFLDKDSTITDMYADLSDRYASVVSEIWDEYLKEVEAQKKADELVKETLWVTCAAGTHKRTESCPVCDSLDDEVGVQVFEDRPAPIDTSKCLVCRRKSRTVLGRTGAWCKKHFNTCSAPNCKGKQTKGMTKDGKRWCHTHSRGLKGYVADSDSKARKRLAQELERVAAY